MPRFDFQAPGSAATDKITAFLEQRRQEERQAMLDALSKQDMEKRWGHQDATLELARGADKRAGEKQAHDILTTDVGMVPGGRDVSGLAPDIRSYLERVGAFTDEPGPQAVTGARVGAFNPETGQMEYSQGSEEPTGQALPGRRLTAGDKDYQAEQRRIGRIQDVSDDPTVKGNDALVRGLAVSAATGGDLPASLMAPNPSFTPYDNVTGKFGTTRQGQPGEQVFERGFPQIGASTRDLYVGTNPATGLPYVQTVGGQFVERPIATLNNDPNARMGAKPSATSGRVPANLLINLANARAELVRQQGLSGGGIGGMFGGMLGMDPTPSPEEQTAQAAYDAIRGAVFAQTNSSPELQEVALEISNDPEDKDKSVTQLIQEGKIDPIRQDGKPLNPADIQMIEQLLSYLRGTPGSDAAPGQQ